MKEVKIVIGGKEYTKVNPMVKDWKNLLEYQSANKEKNLMVDEAPLENIIHLVADYVDAPEERIADECSIDVIMGVFHAIDANILESFIGVNAEKNADGRQRPKK